MGTLFFKSITIKNYKCFEDQKVILKVPNGTEGSGLNILIAENGNGKTTILDALSFVTQSSYTSENKLSINDFNNIDEEILITVETEEFHCKMPYPGNYFECNGIEFKAKNRDRKSPGKLLSSPFQISNNFVNIYANYKK